MYTIAMAYAGTGNNKAMRKLLHVAVSDVNNDVRRAAVQSLGFLLFRTPEQVPSVVSLLSESYNPHVRCGAAMALGIACAGTGLKVSSCSYGTYDHWFIELSGITCTSTFFKNEV